MRVVHVDSAHEWRGSPSQVLLIVVRDGVPDRHPGDEGGDIAGEFGLAAGSFERHFTAGRMVEETLRVYEELTGPRPVTRRVYGFAERKADAA